MEQELTPTRDTMQLLEGIGHPLPREAVETGAGPRLLPCGRHQHVPPVALVTRSPSHVKIRSDQLTYRILLGLLDGKHYIQQPARRLAEYRQTLPKGRGYVSITLSPRSEEVVLYFSLSVEALL